MKKLSAIASLVILLLCLTTACGRKGPEAPPDVTPPAVILTSPINGAQNVAINSSITITFSEAMDASTINEQTITLSMGTGNVPGSVTYSDTTAVFKPSSSLNPGTTYTITVDGGVKDVAGNAMVTPVGFIFFTGTALTPTTMSLSAPAVPYGTDGSVTVTVSSVAGTPTGNVSLSVDGGTPMTQTLAGGSTTFTIPSPSVGTHTLNAAYAEQGNFGASSASGTLGVGQGATAMSLIAPTITYGANGSVTVTVSSASGTPIGDVSLSVDGGSATTQGLIAGSTTFTIPSPSAGSHTLNAVYAAQDTFGASASSGTLIVIPAATTTTITAPAVPYGTDGSVTVTVSSAAGTPTGDVSLSVDGGAATTQGLINGSTTFTITSPSFGSHALNAAYAAQGNFGASFASGTLGVGVGATTMSLSAPTITYGANGSVTVTVSSAAGTPIGNVSLSVDGGSATTLPLDINGSTTFIILLPSAITHTLIAEYAAQGIFGASSASGTLIVNQAATTTTITAPAVTYGADGIVTVTVSSAAGSPTGNVSLTVDGGTPMTQSLISGSTDFTIPGPSAGNHALSATYAAQGNYLASSAIGTLGVGVVATTMSVQSDFNPSIYGNSVTFTATVAPLTATGTVTFMDFGTTIGTGTLSGVQATFSTSTLTGGTHSITAVYSGDTNYSGSTSTVLSQTVNQAPTTTSVLSDSNPSIYGSSVTFTATVSPSTATGTVTFMDDTTVLGTGILSGGVTIFSTSALAGGVHSSITAEYGGDTNFTASTSSVLSQTVNFAIIATAGPHGSISPSGTVSVSSGADQTFTITAQNNFSIVDVLVDGVSQGPVDSYTFPSATANHTIDATFN